MIRVAAIVAFLACGSLSAAENLRPIESVELLEASSTGLEKAKTVPELVLRVEGFEAGFAGYADDMMEIDVRKAQMKGDLERRETEISDLVALLLRANRDAPVVYAMHPESPVDAARAGMLVNDVQQSLQGRAELLRGKLDELSRLQAIGDRADHVLTLALNDVDVARDMLVKAMAERSDVNMRFVEDPVRTAILTSSAASLDAFVQELGNLSATPIEPFQGDLDTVKGTLGLPAQGVVVGGGTALQVLTAPKALVVSPVAGTIRYLGPVPELGNTVIIEPQADTLLVLAGLDLMLGKTGEVIDAGAPLGFMGGETPERSTFVSTEGEDTGTVLSEALYIEAREGGRPVNPETWFRTDKDG